MKSNIKIAVGNIKILYSLLFIIILALVRNIINVEEILPALDVSMALLAMVFCADAYYQEVQEKRWEVFSIVPIHKRYKTVLQRILVQFVYLFFLTAAAYWIFTVQRPQYMTNINPISLYIWSTVNCFLSIIFFGSLSFTLVNLFKNIWVGIGCTFIIWELFNSTVSRYIPLAFNIYPYDVLELSCLSGRLMKEKLLFLVIAILLLLSNRVLMNHGRKVG